MFKRRSKYSVSYTGVDHVPLPAQEPNRNATAAARTIGENMRKAQPHLYGPPQDEHAHDTASHDPRSSSLLKRNSSLLKKKPATSIPQRASSLSMPSKQDQRRLTHSHNHGSDIIGESTRLSSLNASNEARIRDLKLKHQPQKALTHEAPVKMIKKYIPTPNGIQVVEVPESSFKQELARSNSMRSGLAVRSGLLSKVPRSPSLNSKSVKQPPLRRGPGLRLSSFTNEPSIAEEPDFIETREETIQRLKESAFLKSEIEKEKKRSKELEQQRLEFEQLESLRARNNQISKELQEMRKKDLEAPIHRELPKKNYSLDVSYLKPNGDTPGSSFPNVKYDYPLLDQAEDGDDEEDVPIVPVPHAVDEVDLKHAKESGSILAHRDSFVDSSYTIDDLSSQDNPTITSALEVLETYEDHNGSKLLNNSQQKMTDIDFGIEEVGVEQFDSPKLSPSNLSKFEAPAVENGEKTILPTFDPVPEVIGESGLPTQHAASIRSISSLDSKSKPMKSALKKPGVSKVVSVKQSVVSPAEQAYLSLTTAENTRLNSKLSSLQLNGGPEPQPTVKSPPPSGSSTPQKRMSQTLRKQPSISNTGNNGGMANRVARQRRHSDVPVKTSEVEQGPRSSGGGMSSRNFRTDPKPMAPHPALSPNYQSPSKQKAAALYAKANSRPVSHFEPTLRRKSSFSRESEPGEPVLSEPVPKSQMRSLRSSASKSKGTQSMNQFILAGVEPSNPPPAKAAPQIMQGPKPHLPTFVQTQPTYKLKIVDSDDEGDYVPASSLKPSRFADSDDEGPPPRLGTGQPTLRDAQIKPLRDTKSSKSEQSKTAPKEEKKKKKRLLKKLFGLN